MKIHFMNIWHFAKTSVMNYSKRQMNLTFTINPPGDAHDFCKENSALTRSKNRRRKRHKEKIYDVSYKILDNGGMPRARGHAAQIPVINRNGGL